MQPYQLCGQRIVRADRILPPAEEAVAQSSCLGRLIRTHVNYTFIVFAQPPNWQALADQTVRYLRDLIRLDTTNPPGNEIVAAEYIAGVLRAAALDPIVIETAPRQLDRALDR